MHSASGISDMNIKSIIDYSKLKDLHLSKKISNKNTVSVGPALASG